MSLVATLISHPDRPAVDAAALSRAVEALAAPGEPSVLAPGVAVDIACTADAPIVEGEGVAEQAKNL